MSSTTSKTHNLNYAPTIPTLNWILIGMLTIVVLPLFQLIFFYGSVFDSLPISYNALWSSLYFSYLVYSLFIISVIFYILPNLPFYTQANSFSNNSFFTSHNGTDLLKLTLTPIFFILILHSTWTGPALTAWFGHLVFSNFQFKLTYVLYFFFLTYLLVLLSTHHVSSTNFFDFTITIFNFFTWVWTVSFSSNVFTFIFFLELLSAAIMLLLVTSSFSSYHFYNNLSFNKYSYFEISTPTSFLQTLMFFFWITLLSSLTLFLFLIVFYLKFFTFDFGLTTSVFTFLLVHLSLKSLLSVSFPWLMFLIALAIKCGLLPFYLWKPSFFKGMTMISLFFYIYVYYFTIFIMFVYVLCFYFHEVFTFYLSLTILFLIIATAGLTTLIFESFYFKAFLALSSILNSTLVLYALCGFQAIDFLMFI